MDSKSSRLTFWKTVFTGTIILYGMFTVNKGLSLNYRWNFAKILWLNFFLTVVKSTVSLKSMYYLLKRSEEGLCLQELRKWIQKRYKSDIFQNTHLPWSFGTVFTHSTKWLCLRLCVYLPLQALTLVGKGYIPDPKIIIVDFHPDTTLIFFR